MSLLQHLNLSGRERPQSLDGHFGNKDCVDLQISDLPARELLPGDVVELQIGDKVPADIRIVALKTTTLRAEQASLTGESVAVLKRSERIKDADCELQGKECMLFAGTAISNGSCTGIVNSIGMATEIGKIQQQIQEAAEEEDDSPLKKKLDRFGEGLAQVRTRDPTPPARPGESMNHSGPGKLPQSRNPVQHQERSRLGSVGGWEVRLKLSEVTIYMCVSHDVLPQVIFFICILVWLINYHNFLSWESQPNSSIPDWSSVRFSLASCIYYFKIAVALAVAAIPEGLPAVITTCLALGTRKMAKRNAIVRSASCPVASLNPKLTVLRGHVQC